MRSLNTLAFATWLLFPMGLHPQDIPATYRGVGQYISETTLTAKEVDRIQAQLWRLELAHADSLKTTIFPAYEQKELPDSLRAYIYQLAVVSSYQLLGDLDAAVFFQEKEIRLLKQRSGTGSELMAAYSRLMFLQADENEEEKAFKTSLEVVKLLEKEKQPIKKSFIYRQLCVFYHRIKENDRAERFCREGIRHNETSGETYGMNSIYETLALVAAQRGRPADEQIALRRKALKYAYINRDSLDMRIIYRNMAGSFNEKGQLDSAQKYFDLTFLFYERHPFFFGWFIDRVSYADFLLEQNKIEQAKTVMDSLEVIYERSPEHGVSLRRLYGLKARYSARTGQYKAFLHWSGLQDSLLLADYERGKAEAKEEMAAKYETGKREAENALLKAKNKARTVQLLALVVGFLLLLILLALLIRGNRRNKRINTQEQELLNLQLESTRREGELMRQKNEDLRKDLRDRIRQVMEQQVINGELLEMVEELRTSVATPVAKKKTTQIKSKLNEQMGRQLLDEVLERMKELYPELLEYLRAAVGGSKNTEVLCAAMYFMGYGTHDIAGILQRTEKAVRSMRYRIRKKLGLDDQEDLVDFLKEQERELRKNV